MVEEGDDDDFDDIDAELKEQDKGIIEAFAHCEHRVVLSTELEEHVDIGDRQLRRRLNDLVTRDIVGSRKPGRDRLWWLKEDVKEPITVRYPLLGLVRKSSVQLLLLAVVTGIAGAVLTASGSTAMAYEVSPPLVTNESLIYYGLGANIASGLFLVSAGIAAAINWLLLE